MLLNDSSQVIDFRFQTENIDLLINIVKINRKFYYTNTCRSNEMIN
ncbi:MAG: hypothetical protein ACI4XM_03235 [Candidatus Coprovivens sp.]